MKRFILSALLAIPAAMTMAQTNPQSGFIITNEGDTIRGIIDFRTNNKLSKECSFWANGGKEKKIYRPGEIEAFRFDNKGKFFVTRRLNLNGTPELYFAEFMVQGMMNLYYVAYEGNEHYFFEREDGEMAELTNRQMSYTSVGDAKEGAKIILKEKKQQYGKVKQLLQESMSAVAEMDHENLTKKELIDIVRDYHNDVCTDGRSCIVYEYDEKADKVKIYPKVFASYNYFTKYRSDMQRQPDINYSGSSYEIGLGVDIDLARIMKGLSIDIGVAYAPKYKSKQDWQYYGHAARYTNEKSVLAISLGAVKCFGKGKIKPLVRAGGISAFHLGEKEIITYDFTSIPEAREWDKSTHFSVYLGAGLQIPVDKHYVRVHGDWYNSVGTGGITGAKIVKWGVTAEFAF